MKILFLDTMGWTYDPTTPAKQAMGGTQSGVIYLTAELAKLGHAVTVINGVDPPMVSRGVNYRSLPVSAEFLNDFDVIVVVANALGQAVRTGGFKKPMVLWCHHAPNQGAVKDLANPAERAAWQGYAMVSDWQAQTYVDYLGVPRSAMKTLRNGISPYFYNLPQKPRWYTRGTPPILAYSSAPFRGLDILLCAFPLIRARVPGTTLRIYSSMKIYSPEEGDEYIALYELARNLPGVEYVGPLPQGQLAEAFSDTDIWSYPSTFAETSCMAGMEAMAAGMMVITTNSWGAARNHQWPRDPGRPRDQEFGAVDHALRPCRGRHHPEGQFSGSRGEAGPSGAIRAEQFYLGKPRARMGAVAEGGGWSARVLSASEPKFPTAQREGDARLLGHERR